MRTFLHRPTDEAMDEKVVIVANIERYHGLLQTALDDERRSMIRKLLAEDETKLMQLLQAHRISSNAQSR
jgi:hypothetical protein